MPDHQIADPESMEFTYGETGTLHEHVEDSEAQSQHHDAHATQPSKYTAGALDQTSDFQISPSSSTAFTTELALSEIMQRLKDDQATGEKVDNTQPALEQQLSINEFHFCNHISSQFAEIGGSDAMDLSYDGEEKVTNEHLSQSPLTCQSEGSPSITCTFISTLPSLPSSRICSPDRIPEKAFGDLPNDVRARIFRHTFPGPRIIEVELKLSHKHEDSCEQLIRATSVEPPIALYISKESRALALQNYCPLFNLRHPSCLPPKLAWLWAGRAHPADPKEVYFSPKTDIVAFGQDLFQLEDIRYLLGRGAALGKIQNMKFVYDNSQYYKSMQALQDDDESVLQFFDGVKKLFAEVTGTHYWSFRATDVQLKKWKGELEGYLRRGCVGTHYEPAEVDLIR